MAKIPHVYSYQTKRGKRWYYVASCGTDGQGNRKQVKRRGYRTQADAKRAYDEFMADYRANEAMRNSAMTYGRFLETVFLPDYRSGVKESTYETRAVMLRTHTERFAGVALRDLSVSAVQLWKNDLVERYANNYVRLVFGYVQMSLDKAVSLGYLRVNPCRVVGNVRKRKVRIMFWTKDEFERFARTFDLDDYFEFWGFMCCWLLYMTGLRIGEAQALRWSHGVDLEAGAVRVDWQMDFKNQHEWVLTEPKTAKSVRTVALDPVTIGYLTRWRDVQQRNVATDWVLSWSGTPLYGNALRKVMVEHADRAGVKRIKVHGLRHSHASLLIENGENALAVRDRLGHEDVSITLGTYGHLFPNVDTGIASRLGESFEGWGNGVSTGGAANGQEG